MTVTFIIPQSCCTFILKHPCCGNIVRLWFSLAEETPMNCADYVYVVHAAITQF